MNLSAPTMNKVLNQYRCWRAAWFGLYTGSSKKVNSKWH